ncbi:two-component system phosphate regulon response regulator PhoB [Bacillus pakistanensis]|uniref:Two-component system phosphate regulon response regulator PhoB n=1 Tax=Rossellomorea pakistanensis TaxID=992288 RepID=A0ABS2N6V9_9BACI|nr:response regulator transcription factor [Bacillus pakistanensis]MBM7583573.1 two-component system phosphate regulon response regulator PhoB [Bacillus pakistanensis]
MPIQRKNILIIEDDDKIRKLMKIFLEKEGFEVIEAADGKEGQDLFILHDPCFVILDLMLPYVNGEELCSWIRGKQNSQVGIIMVTAKSSEEEKITGLKIGADDYITKPFSPSELVMRVETVLRRTNNHCKKMSIGGLTIKPEKGEVTYKGEMIDLTAFEFLILYYLMVNHGQVISRDQLLDYLYKAQEKVVTERTIDVHVRHLRKKLHLLALDHYIQTVRGMGYKFVIE